MWMPVRDIRYLAPGTTIHYTYKCIDVDSCGRYSELSKCRPQRWQVSKCRRRLVKPFTLRGWVAKRNLLTADTMDQVSHAPRHVVNQYWTVPLVNFEAIQYASSTVHVFLIGKYT